MKKNVMMRVASVMLVLVLMTSSVISGTFAKYTTQDAGSDEARVAKWGISLQVVGDLFGVSYKDGIVASADDTNEAIRVQAADWGSADPSNVVAPGTENKEGMSFGLTGTPEVDYQISAEIVNQNIFLKGGSYAQMIPVDAGAITAQNFNDFVGELYTEASGTYTKAATFNETATYYTLEDDFTLTGDYYPVVFALSGAAGDIVVNTASYDKDSLEEVAAAIAAQLNGSAVAKPTPVDNVYTRTFTSKEYQTNTPISYIALSDMHITWEWAFERKDPSDNVIAMYDYADTVLGNLIADRGVNGLEGEIVKTTDGGATYVALVEYTDYCLDTQFSIDITVTQVN